MCKILFIDNNLDLLHILKLKGITVCKDIKSAKKILENNTFDAIFVDLNLDAERGYAILDLGIKNTPIYLTTSDCVDYSMFSGFLRKPFQMVDLYKMAKGKKNIQK